jgi:hypothetical protein
VDSSPLFLGYSGFEFQTNPSVNNKRQAVEIRKGNNSMLKSIKIKY